MKKIALLLTLLFSIATLAACANTVAPSAPATAPNTPAAAEPANRLEQILADGKITMVTSPDYAPFTFMNPNLSGQEAIVGADIELGKFIAAELGVELVIEPMDFAATLAAVQMGRADMNIGGLTWKEERVGQMMLTKPYNTGSYQGIMIPLAMADTLKTAEDFDDLLVGAQNASLQLQNVETQLPNARVQLVSTIPDGIMLLRTGRIDALAIGGTVGEQFVRNYSDLAMSEFHFELGDSLGTVLAIPNGSQELFDRIEEIIDIVVERGLYTEWLGEAEILADTLALN